MAINRTLIQQCQAGNQKAFYTLYKLCFSDLMSVCARYYRNKEEAAPILNQAFLRITQNLDKYNQDAPWERWVKRIMINTNINDYKSQQKNKEMFLPTNLESGGEAFDKYSVNDILEQINLKHLQSLIHQLPESQKEVFNLYAIDGYTHKEISEMMEIPVGTSKWLLSEARRKLKVLVTNSLNINTAIAI